MISLQELHGQIEQLHTHYDMRFAGHARVTRNPHLMAAMIGQITQIQSRLSEVTTTDPNSHAFVLGLCFERLGLYKKERSEIQTAQKTVGKHGVAAAHKMSDVNFLLNRYHRDFGGEERETRDPGLLGELISALQAIVLGLETDTAQLDQTALQTAGVDVAWVQRQLDALTGEREAILRAQDAGSLDVRAAVLAELANSQFDRHRRHFNEQPRISRRPELLTDMIANLEETLTRMQRLHAQDAFLGNNQQNIDVVERHLAAWREQLPTLLELRRVATPAELMDNLVEAVDAELNLYNRAVTHAAEGTFDLFALGTICDRIGELERQMTSSCESSARPDDHTALARARDARTMLSRTWSSLLEASTEDAATEAS